MESPLGPAVRALISERPLTLDGVPVSRILPAPARRAVGPFVFLDHMGPAELPPGGGLDVRPHPHIHLATVTYLFEGAIFHRDSLGSAQIIEPGAVNLMTAGRGIVHSERTPAAIRSAGQRLHGLQLWAALPIPHEDDEPSFAHHPARALPEREIDGARVRVLVGEAFGLTSPALLPAPAHLVEIRLPTGSTLEVPCDHAERAAYVIDGEVTCDDAVLAPRSLAVLADDATPRLRARTSARVVLLGGATLDAPRTLWWNFVSSSKRRIVEAAERWRAGGFPVVPGDELESIRLESVPNWEGRGSHDSER